MFSIKKGGKMFSHYLSMNAGRFFLLILLLFFATASAQDGRNCKVSFKISGERSDGNGNHETVLNVTQRCYDFDETGLQKQLADDKWRYDGYNYQLIGNPSQKQDCAGYTFQKLFALGPYWITAQEFYHKLIMYFGKQIESVIDPIGWGDIKAGDVLIYRKGGSANHVTYVSEVITTMGVPTSVIIETKDGKEGVYKHTIGLINDPTDPLIVSMGEVWVYKVDPTKVQVAEINRTCDCETDKDVTQKKYIAFNNTGFVKVELSVNNFQIKGNYYEKESNDGNGWKWVRWGEFTGTINESGNIEGVSKIINRTGTEPYEEEILTKGSIGKGKHTGKPGILYLNFKGKDFSESFDGERIEIN